MSLMGKKTKTPRGWESKNFACCGAAALVEYVADEKNKIPDVLLLENYLEYRRHLLFLKNIPSRG